MNIYLDESGNFIGNGSKYFIVGSFTVGDPVRIRNAFHRFQKRKFPKKLKYLAEVKFSDPRLDNKLRLKTIEYFSGQDIRIFYTFLKKENVPEEYRKANRITDTGLLYTHIVAETVKLYLPITEKILWIFYDPRPLKGVSKTKFDEHLEATLLPSLPARAHLEIKRLDSTTSALIQVADWICGALARYHEKKKHGKDFYQILKNNIIRKQELFEDYWLTRWQK